MGNASNKRSDRHRLGTLGYYWFLTFERAPELHALTTECQEQVDRAYFDLTPLGGLHLTLDRIAHTDSAPDQLDAIAAAARHACQGQAPFTVAIERASDVHSAIGFTILPSQPVHHLRDMLRRATLSIAPSAPVKASNGDPHVTIAYPVADGMPGAAVVTVDRINAGIRRVDVTITEVVMVLLERLTNSYVWDVIERVPLTG